MPDTGWITAGTVTGTSWAASDAGALVDAVDASDNVWAQSASGNTNYLICSNFGISLPAGAIIEGHEVRIEASATAPTVFGQTVTMGCRLSKDAANPTGNEREFDVLTYVTHDQTGILGGPTDLWAGGWTDTEISDAGFALLIRKGSSSTDSAGRQVDEVAVKVYFSHPDVGVGARGDIGQMTYLPGVGVRPLTGAVSKE